MWGNSAAKENRKASARWKKTWVAGNDSQRWVECHGNCGPITANRMMGDCLMCFPWVHRRGHGALSSVPGPNLRHCLSGWHLKCCFLTTYANCCNFPDEAASWYLDAAKIVLHFSARAARPFGPCSVSLECYWKPAKLQANCIRLPTLWKGKLLANLFKPLAYFHQPQYLVFMIA